MKSARRPGQNRLNAEAPPKRKRPPEKISAGFRVGQSVALVIGNLTEIGYLAAIDNSSEGLLYRNEVFQPLKKGQRVTGYIKKVRDDGRIDLTLQAPGPEKINEVAQKVLAKLQAQGGFLPLNDTSPPEAIYRMFGASKKTFKKAVGALYKKRLLVLEGGGIKLAAKKGI